MIFEEFEEKLIKMMQIRFAQSGLDKLAKDMEKDFLNDGVICEVSIKVKDIDIEKVKKACEKMAVAIFDDGTVISAKSDEEE